MTIRLGINGMGRIGRNVVRALYETGQQNDMKIVAINDTGGVAINAHLLQYDTAQGRFPHQVSTQGDSLVIDGDVIPLVGDRNPANLPWGEHDVDIVLECTGAFKGKHNASAHITEAGAKKVLISAPGESDVDGTFVYGVNHQGYKPEHTVISNGSCTTNCLAPLAKVLNESVGIEHGLMTTIHAYTNDQVLTDVKHKDFRRARSAPLNQVPTKTGAAKAMGLVLPELNGKLDGFSMRVPTINVSAVDLTFVASRATSVEEINAIVKEAAEGSMKGVLAYNDLPLVSSDFMHHPASSIFDEGQTRVMQGTMVKVLSWYDNEWGFSCRMLDMAKVMMGA